MLPASAARDWKSGASNLLDVNSRPLNEVAVNLLPTPKASDGTHGGPNQRDSSGRYYLPGQPVRVGTDWVGTNGKDYGPAVHRWERVTGHPVPCPTEPGARGNRRLSPLFSEWMMGAEPGWVTDVVTDRNDALHVIGNGVVTRQAEAAFRFLMDDDNWRMDDMTQDDTQTDEKPRGDCTGCKFNYQLGTARAGEHKGQLVVRKHNSRTGPGLCSGAQKPPTGAEELPHDTTTTDPFTAPAAVDPGESGPRVVYSDTPYEVKPDPVVGTLVMPTSMAPDPFTAPGPVSDIPESSVSVSGQPEPDRDRWGRYLLPAEGGRKQAHTRATTFAKLGANTKAIEQWGHRQVAVGLVRRPDLLALADGKDVKRDRTELNSIVEQARDAAGQKVAANIGTAYHSFTERVDAGLMAVEEVPERYRERVNQYVGVTRAAGLSMRPEWIERTTAVRADQVSAPLPVAGTLDRIVQLPDGSLVIADLKTGADLSYGEMEIEVQLAIYAHGVNTFGLLDWNTKAWQATVEDSRGRWPLEVRTDIAIVIHLPADGDGCTLYVADIERGWADAQHLGRLQGSLKTKNRFRTLTRGDLAPAPVQPPEENPWAPAHMAGARTVFLAALDKPRVAELYQFALDSGKFSAPELELLQSLGTKRLRDLGLVPA